MRPVTICAMPSVKDVIDHFGGSQAAAARAFGVTRFAVAYWVRTNRLPARRVYEFREILGRTVGPSVGATPR